MIIYKTTNLVNQKFYIGKDQKNNSNYLGSGLALNRAIKKYGRENFVKEILEECTDPNHLAIREKFWIAKFNAVKTPNSYNIHEGGHGGNTGAYHKVGRAGEKNSMFGAKHTEEEKLAQSLRASAWMRTPEGIEFQKRNIARLKRNNPGKNKSPETCKRISESKKGHPATRQAKYVLISPTNERYEFLTKDKLSAWCKRFNHSLWTIERRLLHKQQPKFGSLVNWRATVSYF